MKLNFTHDPARRSWVDSANLPEADFPLQNLPYGVFRTSSNPTRRLGVAIGDRILDLHAAAEEALVPEKSIAACAQPTLNALMALGAPAWSALRARLSELLGADSPVVELRERVEACLVPMRSATLLLPAQIGDYTDFYASIHHATNVGSMLRPDNPLLPNYKWVPIGYHGRGSSIVASGAPVRRPHGQLKPADAAAPVFAPCKNLDYELEIGAFVGPGNSLGERIPLSAAPQHLFGIVLLNDWSARDIQTWEYQPLGPFLAKNFASTISPWIVTLDALAPFRVAAMPRLCPTSSITTTPPAAASISRSKSGCSPPKCASPATALTGFRGASSPRCIGRSASCSPTTPATAAISRPAICSAAAPSPARRATPAAACSNTPGAAPIRCASRTAKSANFSPTATRSSCAATPSALAHAASASANAAA
jgi:2-keto-4-pentenoate hydratase/2-oxohepta-3-ene-1,7-dioic acid hydratase in catechol pathway